MKSNHILVAAFIVFVSFLSACSIKDINSNECNLNSDCEQGICLDGYKYNKYSCNENKCYENRFFADPCLEHYNDDEAECSDDSDCAVGGCSMSICGSKDSIKDII